MFRLLRSKAKRGLNQFVSINTFTHVSHGSQLPFALKVESKSRESIKVLLLLGSLKKLVAATAPYQPTYSIDRVETRFVFFQLEELSLKLKRRIA